MHTALVRSMVYDARRDRLITASDDKTVRIWQLPKGRLVRVLRVPMATAFEGRLYAIDLHPDGRTIATAGWSGWDLDGEASVYLLDADSGEMIRRVKGFPEQVGALAFSPDGRHLIVGLLGEKGLRILRTSDYAEVGRDLEYSNRIQNLDFAKDGRLAVASLDGYIRLYDARFRLIGRRKTTTGKQPLSIKFSPDDRYLGVAFHDPVPPAIYSTADLTLSHSVDASAIRAQRHLQCLNWSETGDAIYVVGESSEIGLSRIYRWANAGRGATEVIEVPVQRPAGLLPLTKGRMAFVSEDPDIGIIDKSGKVQFIAHTDLADLRLHSEPIRLSPDASAVELRGRQGSAARWVFSLRTRDLIAVDAATPLFAVPKASSKRFVIEGWQGETKPILNGVPLQLDDYETSRSYTVSPDETLLVLGTEWAVRAYDRNSRLLWTARMSAVVWQVAVSPDGESVVAALSDGTLRWLRMKDGAEYMALFVHLPSKEWIAWIPSGYYVASNNGDKYMGWHVNRGREGTPRFYQARQFERHLYRPDLVDTAFRTQNGQITTSESGGAELFDISKLTAIAPPMVRLTYIASATSPTDDAQRARLKVEARADNVPMRDITLFVNDIPVTPRRGRALRGEETWQLTREVSVDLAESENRIRVAIFNGHATGVDEVILDAAPLPKPRAPQPGNLFVVAVGINKFPLLRAPSGGPVDLRFAARDAAEIARFFKTNGPDYFHDVFVRSISDESGERPTQEQIIRALDFLSDAGARDTVILFLASYGVSDPSGNYYFVPADARTEDWAAAKFGGGTPASLIQERVFLDALQQVAGRRILILDTRSMEGKLDLRSLSKRSDSSLLSLVVAVEAEEKPEEKTEVRHGLFTYAFLEALRRDPDKDGYITLEEAFKNALPIAEKTRNPRFRQPPQLGAPSRLKSPILARREK